MPRALTAVRTGAAADADALTAIFLAARAGMTYLPALHTDAETRWWMEHVVLGGSRVLVATSDGQPAGFAAIGPGTLKHLYVRPDAQRAGLGSALLEAAQATEPSLVLHVFAQNAAAIRLYRRHGFAVTGGSDGSGNEEGLPDLEMTWRP
ncbi:putative acetyltransferase [Stella humosa]|uniref:Putative acetyltransferase n=1 Tax=Stella humosa TaxID=94 RepID=A0A3N1ME48_9PROT|nr:GNAT family N-acetyltransferase [Stella humosa]ROQ02003.1 putative acetyltransferase [Stella humosa]BBK32392.1 hypothetical protein STHU_30260 [Stella humosa]